MKTTVPAGLSLSDNGFGWKVIHTRSGKPIHSGEFRIKSDAAAATAALAPLGIDWDQPGDQVLAAVDRHPNGRNVVRSLMLPPEERERRTRAAANCVRYLKALEAEGVTIVEKTAHGIGGTSYTMSCGCVRIFSVPFAYFTPSPEPDEDLAVRCRTHTDLSIDPAPTDSTSCATAVRAAAKARKEAQSSR